MTSCVSALTSCVCLKASCCTFSTSTIRIGWKALPSPGVTTFGFLIAFGSLDSALAVSGVASLLVVLVVVMGFLLFGRVNRCLRRLFSASVSSGEMEICVLNKGYLTVVAEKLDYMRDVTTEIKF